MNFVWWTIISSPHKLVRVQSGRGHLTDGRGRTMCPERGSPDWGWFQEGSKQQWDNLPKRERPHRKSLSFVVRQAWVEILINIFIIKLNIIWHLLLYPTPLCLSPDLLGRSRRPIFQCNCCQPKLGCSSKPPAQCRAAMPVAWGNTTEVAVEATPARAAW